MLSLWVSLDTTRGHSKEEAIVEETVEDSADEASVETVAETPAETNVPDWMFAALLTSSDPARGMPETLPPGLDADTEGSL